VRVRPYVDGRLDLGTLDEVAEIIAALAPVSQEAVLAAAHVEQLRMACDRHGSLPQKHRRQLGALVGMLEERLA
jgi:hypothetical protein